MDSASLTLAERARAALLEHLSPQQRAEFKRTGMFRVRGSKGNYYRVGGNYNAVERERGWWFVRHAAGVHGIWLSERYMDKLDHVLAHKLLLEADEREFQRVACYQRYYV